MRVILAGVALTALASGMAMAAPATPKPRSPASPVEMFHGEIDIRRQSRTFQPDPAKLSEGSFGDTRWDKWLDPADLPLDLRNRSVTLSAYLAVDVDAAGKVAGCRLLKSSNYADFDALACKAVSEKGSFDPFYQVPGAPLAQTLNLSVRWRNVLHSEWEKRGRMLSPPAPPRPPPPSALSGWPRDYAPSNIHITSFPKLADHVPPKVKAKGISSIDLTVSPTLGVTGCKVGVSSGAAVLDEAACTVAAELPLSYGSRGCDGCRAVALPLQFVWAGKASHIRVPLPSYFGVQQGWEIAPRDPADTRNAVGHRPNGHLQSFALSDKDFADLPDKTITRERVSMFVRYGADGRAVQCKKWSAGTSGNAAVDDRLCALMVKRGRFQPRQDVFGTDVGEEVHVPLNLFKITSLTKRPPQAISETRP